MERFDEGRHFVDLYLRAQDFTYAALDIISFSTSKHHRLIIEKWIKPTGESADIYDQFHDMPQLNSAAVNFDVLLNIILREPPLFRAMRDLISGTMEPHASAVNCGRVVDALRRLIAPNLERKQGWARFRSILRVERPYVELITNTATAPRHGSFDRIKGDVTNEIAIRTWTLMNRYLEYRKRGNQPLPEAEFPVLA